MTEVLPRTDRTVADGTWNARLPVSIRPRAKDRCDRSPRCIKTFQAASSLRRICRKLLTANDARPADAAPGISMQMNHLQTEAACRARTRRTEPREPVCEWRWRMDCRRFPPRCVRARRLRRGTRAMGCPTMVETRQRCSDPSGGRTAQPEDAIECAGASACAASTAVFSARMLVWKAMPSIVSMISERRRRPADSPVDWSGASCRHCSHDGRRSRLRSPSATDCTSTPRCCIGRALARTPTTTSPM